MVCVYNVTVIESHVTVIESHHIEELEKRNTNNKLVYMFILSK